MAVAAGTKSLAKLARLVLDLEGRWKSYSELRAGVENARRAGLVASGEAALLDKLQVLLTQADAALNALSEAESGADLADRLATIEAIVDDVQWEVSDDVAKELAERVLQRAQQAADQQGQLTEFQIQIREWQKHIDDFSTAVLNADKANAPVTNEIRFRNTLDALVKGAQRALDDRKYTEVRDALGTLDKLGGKPPESAGIAKDGKPTILDTNSKEVTAKPPEPAGAAKDDKSTILDTISGEVTAKMKAAQPLARQADLLLIRSELANDRYQYTLLLRTPREPGTPGIDIQDESTMVAQDHKFFEDTVDDITKQIRAGLVRAMESPPPDAGAAPAAPAPAAAAPAAPPAGDDARDVIFRSSPDAGPAPRPAVELVQEIGDLMYRLVVPETMQRFLIENKSSLTIRTNDVELPWELMRIQPREGPAEYLCLERPVARMPTGRAFPRRETKKDRGGKPLRFLLIYSDPNTDRPLVGARAEVEAIRAALSSKVEVIQTTKGEAVGGIDMLMLKEVTGKKLNSILLGGEYDVIHYAGHAAFDRENADLSGLLLWDKEVLFAQKVRRLLEGRPLVFVNACESGRAAEEEKPKKPLKSEQSPAEGIISSFIYGGAASCIGSIWPVYDESARMFAITFYQHVLDGYMVGEALRQARLKTREAFPKQITWASFVLYGDPTARLTT